MADAPQLGLPDWQAIATRLAGQVGQAALDMAAYEQVNATLRQTIDDLTVELAQAQGEGGVA